ncbi:hypothetical protein HAP94_13100 [Acidithiobacillus ferrivorans]|nr:hypothetical protein [Acidithiobacillus ferrivorans]
MVAKLHLMSANFSNRLAPEAAESSSGGKTLGAMKSPYGIKRWGNFFEAVRH